MSKSEEAAELMTNSRMNCAQAVLSVFTQELELDKSTALKVALGFGAGMGRTGGVCGAVTGALYSARAEILPRATVSSGKERKGLFAGQGVQQEILLAE